MGGQSYTADQIIKAIQRREKFEELNGRSEFSQSQAIKSDVGADKIQLALDSDIRKQKDNIYGHKLAEGYHKVVDKATKPAGLLAEFYEVYLSSYQRCSDAKDRGQVILSKISNRPFVDLTFDDFVNEAKLQNIWMKDTELPRLRKKGKMKKEAYDLSHFMAIRIIEACNVYLSALESQKVGLV